MIVAGMRNWLDGGELDGGKKKTTATTTTTTTAAAAATTNLIDPAANPDRVAVVHCKAGKGRSGTAAVSYLIAEEGWTAEAALARFTERRMRRGFGSGVSIPSQRRTINYVDRWANAWQRANPDLAAKADADAATVRRHRHYIDRPVEIVEVHAWGLRNGVVLEIAGFADEGKRIEVRHIFAKEERIVVLGDPPGGAGIVDMVYDMAGYDVANDDVTNLGGCSDLDGKNASESESGSVSGKWNGNGNVNRKHPKTTKSMTAAASFTFSSTSSSPVPSTSASDASEPGGRAVIFRPARPVTVPNSDVLVRLERRHRAPRAVAGLTMVTAVAHAWFNVFFEGRGPEQMAVGKSPERSGVFELGWDALDGFKGSGRKGTRAVDRIAVVWRVVGEGIDELEPGDGEPVPQMSPADWRGVDAGREEGENNGDEETDERRASGKEAGAEQGGSDDDDDDDLEAVKSSGPAG